MDCGTCGDSNVVHVDPNSRTKEFMFGDDRRKNVIHHGLERGGRISESEKNEKGFKKSVACFEWRFVFVTLLDPDIVIPPSNIEFRVDVCAAKVGNEVRDEG